MNLCIPLSRVTTYNPGLRRLVTLVFLTGVSLIIPYAHAGVDLSKYSIVFEDNFNGDSLDTSKWNTAFLWGPYLPINSEEQLYIDKTGMHQSAAVSPFEFTGSTLKIIARKNTATSPLPSRPAKSDPVWNKYPEYRYNDNYEEKNSQYTSGIITSYDSYRFTHGYAETSARLPKGAGLWSAFWLLNAFYVEDSPEIDIMEALGHKPDSVFQSYHFFDIKNGWQLISSPTHETTGDDYSAGFHTFGVSWEPDRIIWYVDGAEVHRVNASSQVNGRVAAQAMYVIANLAVGGVWPGSPTDETNFPAEYEIDYIRVFKRIPPERITPAILKSEYQLMFSDEFDSGSLDPNKWNTSYLWGPFLQINAEQQYYVDKLGRDKSVPINPFRFPEGKGILQIEAKPVETEALPTQAPTNNQIWTQFPTHQYNPNYRAASGWNPAYTSGVITSYDAFKFVNGYAEIRARVPKGQGLWPAFWLLNGYYVWRQPEIDVLEIKGQETDRVHHSYHYFDNNGALKSSAETYRLPSGDDDFSAGFHTFGVAWQPGSVSWYVDGKKTRQFDNPNVSEQLMYVIANLAVGGTFVGDVDRSATPATFDIDYIRVYQQQAAHQASDTSDVVARAKNTAIELDASGVADLLAENIDDGSSADSGIASMRVTPQQLTCDDTDGANVTLTVTSNQGYNDAASATVTAVDRVKPQVRTKDASVGLGEERSVTLRADAIDNGSNDACGIASSSISPDTFDSTGTKTVTLSVTDNNGNTATSTARVTIVEGDTTETDPGSKLPSIVTPANNSTVNTTSMTFTWSANQTDVSEWWLFIGSAPRQRNLYSSGRLGKLSQSVSINLDTSAAQLHASLYYKVSGKWSLVESRYTGNTDVDSGDDSNDDAEDNDSTSEESSDSPAITSPAPESTLSAEAPTFKWVDNGSNVSTWWLFAGTSAGARDVFSSGRLNANTLSVKIPAEAVTRTTHVSLYFKISGKWQRRIFSYRQNSAYDGDTGSDDNDSGEVSSLPALQSPSTNQALPPGKTTFSWANNGFKVTEWWLYAGSKANAHDLHNSGRLAGPTRSATLNLQGETGKLHITLYYKTAGKWSPRSYVFNRAKATDASLPRASFSTAVKTDVSAPTGDNSGKPGMINPLDGDRKAGEKVTLQWSANSAEVTQWWVLLGKVAGGSELFDSGRMPASNTSLEVDMPGGDRTIHVTLHYQVNGGWTSTRSRFTSD